MLRYLAPAAVVACSIVVSAQTVVPAGPGGFPGAQRPQDAAKPGTAIITGHILAGDDGMPIAAATVALSGGSLPRFDALRVLTDAQGRFFFTDLAAGTYDLTTTKPGWMTGALGRSRPSGTSTPLVIAEGDHQTDLAIRLWRSAVITGTVADKGGEPIVGADVRAFRISYRGGRPQPVFIVRVRTDDRGVYRFAGLEPGDYLICAPATVTSEPSGFSGVINALGEQPHAYLQTMSGVGSVPMTLGRSNGHSGVDRWGISSVADMPTPPPASGPWLTYPTTFAASALTPASATVVRARSGQERAGVDLVLALTPTFQVSGTVTGPDGPAAYHAVHLLPADAADAPLVDTSTAITDSAGAFTFFGVPAGTYVARVVRTPWPSGAQRLGTGSSGNGSISYVMTFSSGPPTGPPAPVPSEPLLHATVPVAVGDRDVRDVTLTLQTGPRVSGRVQFDGTAAPPVADDMQRMQVTLEHADGQEFSNVTPGVVSATGQFMTPGLWPGRYLIRVNNAPKGWTLKSAITGNRDASESAVDLASDVDDVVLLFTDKISTLSGTVQTDRSIANLGAAVVLLFPVDRAGWRDYGRTSRRVRSTGVSKAGTFSMPTPPDGDYFLIAIPDSEAADWQNPAVLDALAARADRISIRDGQPVTHPLTLRQTGRRDQ